MGDPAPSSGPDHLPDLLPDLLNQAARTHPDAPCLAYAEATYSFAQVETAVQHMAQRLGAQGLLPGSCVALVLPNGPALLILLTACLRAGYCAAPLSIRLPDAALRAYLQTLGEPPLMDAAHPLVAEAAASLLAPVGSPEAVPMVPAEQPATVIFTSGSTGTPKGVVLPYRAHVYSAAGINAVLDLRRGDRWLLDLPLYHVGGLAIWFRCLMAGATAVVRAQDEDRLALFRQARLTHASMVAAQLRWLLDAEVAVPSTLRHVLLGGSAIPRPLLEAAHTAGWPLHTSYGMTEMASTVTVTPPEASLDVLATAGQPLPHRTLALADDGRIGVGGRTAMLGFLEGGELAEPLPPDAWWWTRDLGRWDAEGNLCIEGRIDNMFVSGGENVQPEMIERVLQLHPAVQRAVVVPVPDATFGARPVAFIAPHPTPMPTDLPGLLETHLPRYQHPIAYFGLPADNPGEMKLRRTVLREEALLRHRASSD